MILLFFLFCATKCEDLLSKGTAIAVDYVCIYDETVFVFKTTPIAVGHLHHYAHLIVCTI